MSRSARLVLACSVLLASGCDLFEDDGVSLASAEGTPIYTAQNPGPGDGGDNVVEGALSCDLIALDGRCFDYVGPDWADQPQLAATECQQNNGEFVEDERCPTFDLLGTCRLNAGARDQINIRFYLGQFTEADAADRGRTCELEGGQWQSEV